MQSSTLDRIFLKNMFASSLSTLFLSIGSILDAMIVGKLIGDNALTAYGLTPPILFFMTAQLGVFMAGMQNCGGTAIGKGNARLGDEYFSSALIFETALSVFISLVLFFFPSSVSYILGASKHSTEIFEQTRDYILGISSGLPFLAVSSILMNIMYIEGKGQKVLIAILLAITTNICGDLYVAHTSGSMLGIGIATSLGEILSCLYLVCCRLGNEKAVSLSIRNTRFKLMGSIIKGGSTTGFIRASHMFRIWILNFILTYYLGKEAVSALSIQNSSSVFFISVVGGTGAAILSIGSLFYGENDENSMKQLIHKAALYGIIICTGVLIIIFIVSKQLVNFYTDNAVIANLANQGILIYALGIPFFMLDMIFVQYYMSVKKYNLSAVLSFISNFVSVIIAALLLFKPFGMTGIWFSFPVGYALSLLFVLGVGYYSNHKLPKNISECMIPFSISKYREVNYICNTPKQLSEASESIRLTALEWGLNKSGANKASLCIEEYGILLMSKVFHQDKKQRAQNNFSIRMVEMEDKIMIRIRDNYPTLNSLEWMKAHQYETDEKNISENSLPIKLIFSSINEIEYRNIMGLNTIIITIGGTDKKLDKIRK